MKKRFLCVALGVLLLSGCGLVDQTIQDGKQAIEEGTKAIQEGAQSIQNVANITTEIDRIYTTATEQTFNEMIEPLRQEYQNLTSAISWEQLGVEFNTSIQEAINSTNLDTFKQWVESEGYQQFSQSVDGMVKNITGQ
ncbi:hypothetical protein [Paenibacillus agilis]|uniref:Lipoprotein n=1 Tax=Paenibacillus agilis TaxID=3020863 RepID=A0A559ICA5_9BACL|nr:hypothetical protein [Paenibacillus agilis]TVX85276.1 hypothetical protein FPZ44_25515 [Paenibacillus agilis]